MGEGDTLKEPLPETAVGVGGGVGVRVGVAVAFGVAVGRLRTVTESLSSSWSSELRSSLTVPVPAEQPYRVTETDRTSTSALSERLAHDELVPIGPLILNFTPRSLGRRLYARAVVDPPT